MTTRKKIHDSNPVGSLGLWIEGVIQVPLLLHRLWGQGALVFVLMLQQLVVHLHSLCHETLQQAEINLMCLSLELLLPETLFDLLQKIRILLHFELEFVDKSWNIGRVPRSFGLQNPANINTYKKIFFLRNLSDMVERWMRFLCSVLMLSYFAAPSLSRLMACSKAPSYWEHPSAVLCKSINASCR